MCYCSYLVHVGLFFVYIRISYSSLSLLDSCARPPHSQRLKDAQSSEFLLLKSFGAAHSILLTGTPVQNSLREFFNLLSFLDQDEFGDVDGLLKRFGDVSSAAQMNKLSDFIRPYILQRIKEDHLDELPPKTETVIVVALTREQRDLYQAVERRDAQLFGALTGHAARIKSIITQFRQICNHPFTQDGVERALYQYGPVLNAEETQRLVEASGKFLLLDKLLRDLLAGDHKVLIFSQFVQTLDLLHDFLLGRGWTCVCLDGRTTPAQREIAIAQFKAGDARDCFVFLISTKAGGVGLNLTEADTVILFDGDYNVQGDRVGLVNACVGDCPPSFRTDMCLTLPPTCPTASDCSRSSHRAEETRESFSTLVSWHL